MQQQEQVPAKTASQLNIVVKVGLWLTVIAAALWAGGHIINKISMYLPYAFGIGVGLMVVGLAFQYKKVVKTKPAVP